VRVRDPSETVVVREQLGVASVSRREDERVTEASPVDG